MTRWLAFHLSPVERLWRHEVLPALRAGLDRVRDTPLEDLTSAEVLRRIRTVEDLSARYWAVIGGLAWHWNTSEWLLGVVLAHGGRHTAGLTTGSLLVGEDRLAHQADRALDRVAAATPEDEERLLQEYLRCFGHLVYSLDLAEPTAIDDPSVLRSVIAGRRDGGEPSALAPASSPGGGPSPRLGRGPVGRLRRGVHRWAHHWSGVRDEALHSVTLGWPFMRAGYLELGRRLVLADLLDVEDDVFYLTGEELSGWVNADADDPRWRALVRERRLRRQRQRRLDPPDVVPTDARITLFGSDITSLALFGTERGQDNGDGLSGSAVSPGSYTGRARVIHEFADAGTLEKGEVLVVRQVTPAWAPLLARAGAVVADVGGALPHGSVVAREYGIPAVMGVRTATSRIGTGHAGRGRRQRHCVVTERGVTPTESPPRSTGTRGRVIRLLLFVAVSISLVFTLWGMDRGHLWAALKGADWRWLAVTVLANIASQMTRAVGWNAMFTDVRIQFPLLVRIEFAMLPQIPLGTIAMADNSILRNRTKRDAA